MNIVPLLSSVFQILSLIHPKLYFKIILSRTCLQLILSNIPKLQGDLNNKTRPKFRSWTLVWSSDGRHLNHDRKSRQSLVLGPQILNLVSEYQGIQIFLLFRGTLFGSPLSNFNAFSRDGFWCFIDIYSGTKLNHFWLTIWSATWCLSKSVGIIHSTCNSTLSIIVHGSLKRA